MNSEYQSELDARIKEKIQKHECIAEPELLDRIQEVYRELRFTIDDLNDKSKEVETANHMSVVKGCCKHYKGQLDNDYMDCTVICDLHNDDYVSRSACETCKDFERVDDTHEVTVDEDNGKCHHCVFVSDCVYSESEGYQGCSRFKSNDDTSRNMIDEIKKLRQEIAEFQTTMMMCYNNIMNKRN